eukprot:m.18073 g.18073  ORF g.18073 m.18073 type:complete len:979 (+) comp27590_c0_seq1:277-3213(+)
MASKKRKVCGLDVSLELLLPGLAVVPGGRDLRGGPVIECQRKTYDQKMVSPDAVIDLFEYLVTVPRNESRKKGLSIIIDGRDTPPTDLQTLLNAVSAIQTDDSKLIHMVYLVGFDKKEKEHRFPVTYLSGVDELSQYVATDQLTSALGGSAPYDHEQWIRFRFSIEPFLTDCSSCAKTLREAIQPEPGSAPVSPQSAEGLLKRLRVNELIKESGQIVSRLCDPPPDWQSLAWSPDFKALTAYVNQMAAQLQNLKARLEATSGTRKRRSTREYPMEVDSKEMLDKVVEFVNVEGKEFLEEEIQVDSLGAVDLLLEDMADFEDTAKNILTGGRTVAENVLKTEEGASAEEREKATSVLARIKSFVERLGKRRERLQSFREYHQLIDRAFGWSVQAARFLSRQEVAADASDGHLSELLIECQSFREKHAGGLTKSEIEKLTSLSQSLHLPQVEVAIMASQEADTRFQARWLFIESLLRKDAGKDDDVKSVDFEAFEVSDSEDEMDTVSEDSYVTSSATATLSLAIAEARLASQPEKEADAGGEGKMETETEAEATGKEKLESCSDRIHDVESDESDELDSPTAGADLSKEAEKIKRRKQLVNEMIETEVKYVDDLENVCKNYVNAYLTSDMIPNSMRGKMNILFGNIVTLVDFNKTRFLPELKKYHGTPLKLGSCFVFFEQDFGFYSLYFKNMPAQEEMLQENQPREFFRTVQIRLNDPFSLQSYLIKPFQRMVKYRQFLEEIKKKAPAGLHPKTADNLDAAIHLIKFQLRHGNDLLSLDCLKKFDGNVDELGLLLLQDDFIVSDRRGRHKRRLFLFEESILFCKQREVKGSSFPCFDYKANMKTADMGMTENKGNDSCKFEIWFRKRKQQDTLVLMAKDSTKKMEWVQEIHHLLFRQMKRLKEHKARSSNAPVLAPRRQRSTLGYSITSDLQTPRTSINPGTVRGSHISINPSITRASVLTTKSDGSVDSTKSGLDPSWV